MMKVLNQLNDYYCLDFEINKINANSNVKSRDHILNDFQYKNDKIQLLFSIRILDECIDIPSCDSQDSKIDYYFDIDILIIYIKYIYIYIFYPIKSGLVIFQSK